MTQGSSSRRYGITVLLDCVPIGADGVVEYLRWVQGHTGGSAGAQVRMLVAYSGVQAIE
jgi:hypothetical protein